MKLRTSVFTGVLALWLAACGGTDPAARPTAAAQSAPAALTQPDSPPSDPDSPPSDRDEPSPLEPSEPFGLATVTVTGGDRVVRVPSYVADDDQTRRRGLMFREELHPEAGMIFVFPDERSGGFWMKDTLIPLSILFYGPGGDVRAVLDMEPCEADPCPVYDPGVTYVGAIEVNKGYFDEIGLEVGWQVELPAGIDAAS